MRDDAEFWLDHVLEVHTGLPGFVAPGAVPRPCFDPDRTTLRQRYATKAAELRAAHHQVSAGTVERKRLAWLREGCGGWSTSAVCAPRRPTAASMSRSCACC
ncbi:hypothetical protein GTX14_25405 [Streptomyces sp. SID4944]|nr:hypothetical protein [Streptomyces sp. SID4944]